MHSTPPVRVLLVERLPVLSSETRSALSTSRTFQVVGHAASAVDATRLARAMKPDLAVCETTLPEPGALELARFFRVRMPETRVVFITRSQTEDELFEAARVGVTAYLSGGMEPADFLHALLRVSHGEYLIDDAVARTPAVAVRILGLFRAGSDRAAQPGQWSAAATLETAAPAARLAPLFVPLSQREIEILDLVARGNSNKLVARQLGISDQTVKNHITTILRKLEVNDRTEAVVTALRNGWIKIDAPARAAGNG